MSGTFSCKLILGVTGAGHSYVFTPDHTQILGLSETEYVLFHVVHTLRIFSPASSCERRFEEA